MNSPKRQFRFLQPKKFNSLFQNQQTFSRMKLTKIKISDFRSILNQEINFGENCIGLIGLNESGKSNVLNAIRILDNNYQLSFKDKSKISRKFPKIECEFLLEETDNENLKSLQEKYGTDMTYSPGFQLSVSHPSSIIQTIQVIDSSGVISRDISFNFPVEISTSSPVSRLINASGIPAEDSTSGEGIAIDFSKVNLIEKKLIREEFSANFENYEVASIKRDIEDMFQTYFKALIPQVIFWAFDDKYLLPSEILYEIFVNNGEPYNNSAPLFNIFLLSHSLRIKNAEDLSAKISQWKSDSSERRRDGAIITESINNYIKRIWSDYDQELKIELEETKITIHINDPKSIEKNFYAMEARSQGFKTFISFILTIAAEAENGIINNFILLLDEPETHLHPSGVRYMKEELLKLSTAQNYIIFTTHSIFMIDRDNLRRHIIVSKENEITKLTAVKRNNFIQEAVIYEALGTQLDEFSIGNKNIVVEGELDLLLLTFYIDLFTEVELTKNIKDSKIWDGGGTSKIQTFFSSKILPHASNWLVILDNDSAGQNVSKWLKANFGKTSNIKMVSQHYSDQPNYELEEILPKDILKKSFDQTVLNLSIAVVHPADILNDKRVFSSITNDFKARNGLTAEEKSIFEEKFKEELYKNINEVLNSIKGSPGEVDKKSAFKAAFPFYHESLIKIIGK